jgi:lysophospholipase L1-like esterase
VGADAAIKIMPLGDSITYGTPHPRYGGYRHALWTLLNGDGFRVNFVGSQHSGDGVIPDPNNEGHPGWTIPQIKNGVDRNGWLEKTRPDVILLHIGTNDIRYGYVQSAPSYLTALLDDILARLPRAHVIVAQIIPFQVGQDGAGLGERTTTGARQTATGEHFKQVWVGLPTLCGACGGHAPAPGR